MDDLAAFERSIEERLTSAQARRRESQQVLSCEMAEHERRTQQFEKTSARVMELIIRPYVQKLVSVFPNAHLLTDGGSTRHHSVCRFDHTPDYPASTKLDFGVSPDVKITNVIVTYTLEILPVFFEFDGHDQIAVRLSAVDEPALSSWGRAKLLAFVDTYLRLQLVEQYQQENIVVDPVCGMSLNRANARASFEHEGQTYYFCVDECCTKFKRDPARYVARHT